MTARTRREDLAVADLFGDTTVTRYQVKTVGIPGWMRSTLESAIEDGIRAYDRTRLPTVIYAYVFPTLHCDTADRGTWVASILEPWPEPSP